MHCFLNGRIELSSLAAPTAQDRAAVASLSPVEREQLAEEIAALAWESPDSHLSAADIRDRAMQRLARVVEQNDQTAG